MNPQVTLVVAPRERFSHAVKSLESLCANTPSPFHLVYVDGGSPRETLRSIEAIAARRGFEVIRSDRYLSPNEARNLGIARVKTPYAVFVDNDVLFHPGWLDALVACAEETGAWVVTPLILESPDEPGTVHLAGGEMRFIEVGEKRMLRQSLNFPSTPLKDIQGSLRRSEIGFSEFHCLLTRKAVLDRLGPLDEELKSQHEHLDFSWSVRQAGGSLYFEPASRVRFDKDAPFEEGDYAYFFLRWSDAWNGSSYRRFDAKWNLSKDEEGFRRHLGWLERHRSRILKDNPAALKWLLNEGERTDSNSR